MFHGRLDFPNRVGRSIKQTHCCKKFPVTSYTVFDCKHVVSKIAGNVRSVRK